MAIGAIGMAATGGAMQEVSGHGREDARATMQTAQVPGPVIEQVLLGQPIAEAHRNWLTPEQVQAVDIAEMQLQASEAGAALGAGLAGSLWIAVIVSGLFWGLVGLLLRLKKSILQCDNCGAVVAAS